jgi:glucosamine 6-phosphate synthetase-like amidotransferase/phosphosugar isomerase protein
MCGILGGFIAQSNQEVVRTLRSVFIAQQDRGIEGGGIMVRNRKGIYRMRSVSPFDIFDSTGINAWKHLSDGSVVMIHHRRPTSTPNRWQCNHPIANEGRSIYMIHNGMIHHTRAFVKASHTFETAYKDTFTDSEIAIHRLEELQSGKGRNDALIALAEDFNHSFAAAFVFKDESAIYLIRNGNPIIISKDAHGNTFFSSELKDTSLTKIKAMKEGEVGRIDATGYTTIKEGKDYLETAGAYKTYDWAWNGWGQAPITSAQSLSVNQREIVSRIVLNNAGIPKDSVCMLAYQRISRLIPSNLSFDRVMAEIEDIYDNNQADPSWDAAWEG